MTFLYFMDSLLSAVSLTMDALAMALCIGAGFQGATNGTGLRMGAACGLFQAGMPLVGWVLGEYALVYISSFDHWVAFGLLAFVGGNMIRNAYASGEGGAAYASDPTKSWALLYLALATSIDALAVGAGFSISGRPILTLAVSSGVITAVFCYAGVHLGKYAGCRLGKKMEIAGGIVLILIGLNILREHLVP